MQSFFESVPPLRERRSARRQAHRKRVCADDPLLPVCAVLENRFENGTLVVLSQRHGLGSSLLLRCGAVAKESLAVMEEIAGKHRRAYSERGARCGGWVEERANNSAHAPSSGSGMSSSLRPLIGS